MANGKYRDGRWSVPGKRAKGYAEERKAKVHKWGDKEGKELTDYEAGMRSGYLQCQNDHGGMFKYVSSANYYGEITEWFGFAILTWSLPGIIFCMWTFANLAPRANSLYEKYAKEFGEEFTSLKRKRLIPFIY